MLRIKLSESGASPFERLIGHNRDILAKWTDLENALFNSSSLPRNMLEQVRRTLAFGNRCEYCMVKGGKPAIGKGNIKEQLASSFAGLFVADHKSITDEHFNILRTEFTDKEISELCSFISFISACQKLGRIYNLSEDFQADKVTTMKEIEEEE